MDMILLQDYQTWQNEFDSATIMYKSLDGAYSFAQATSRYRSAVILLIMLRFMLQGSFSLSRMTTVMFSRLVCVYIILLIMLIPFIAALAFLVMVLEVGSPLQVVDFGNAIRDIFLIVTGVNDRLTAATPRIGRQTGWSIVFYLFLITFTWVLVVPTLIAFAVLAYERASNDKSKYLEEEALVTSAQSLLSEDERGFSTSPPAALKRVLSATDFDPNEEKSAVQILFEGSVDMMRSAPEFVSTSILRRKRNSVETTTTL
jgi:hypothetical protein